MPKVFKEERKVVKKPTRDDNMLQWVLERLGISMEALRPRHMEWKDHYMRYRGVQSDTKEPWQANYSIQALKEVVRIKVPLYLNILFSRGIKSFDIEAGDISDEDKLQIVKDVLIYQLRNIGRETGGFFGEWGNYCKQFEMYGYTAAMCPWVEEQDLKGHTTFDQPDMQTLDIFHFFPDPSVFGVNSWKIVQERDKLLSYLRMQQALGRYENVSDLQYTNQPNEYDDVIIQPEDRPDFNPDADVRIELLEYHGELPKSLLEGKGSDINNIDPYEDEYVDAIVTIGNREVILRAEETGYDCGSIFIESCKDRLPSEKFGIGTGEDISSMVEELTNSHNKLSDCVNIISNPMDIVNPTQMSGLSNVLVTHPGKMFVANSMTDDVRKALTFVDTTAAASALSPLLELIRMLDHRIQKLSQATPSISPVTEAGEMHETLGGSQMQQANAAEPIKHTVKHELEPSWQKVLMIFYKLSLQYFTDVNAYKVLGKDGAEAWMKIKNTKLMTRADLALVGDPDFIPRGVTVFSEKQVELKNLLQFFQIAIQAVVPKTDENGQQVPGPDGKPQMEPVADIAEIIKRAAQLMDFDDLDALLPGLKALREKQQASKKIIEKEQKDRQEITNNMSQSGTPTPDSTAVGRPPTTAVRGQ